MPASEIPRRFSPTIDELLPSQTGNSGKVLQSDGTNSSWQTVGGGVSDGDKGDITVSASGATWTIDANAVTNGKIRQSSGLSLLGRSANSTGDIADITAGSDGHVLRRSGTTLGFGEIATAGIANSAVTYAKIQNVSATQRLLGKNTAGAGVIEELAISTILDWLSSTQGTILYRGASGWTTLATGTAGNILKTGGSGANPSWGVFTPRVQTVTSSATVTPNADTDDLVKVTAQATGLTFANPTGTPVDGQVIMFWWKDNGTSRTLAFGNAYVFYSTFPTSSTISKWMQFIATYNTTDSKWHVSPPNIQS